MVLHEHLQIRKKHTSFSCWSFICICTWLAICRKRSGYNCASSARFCSSRIIRMRRSCSSWLRSSVISLLSSSAMESSPYSDVTLRLMPSSDDSTNRNNETCITIRFHTGNLFSSQHKPMHERRTYFRRGHYPHIIIASPAKPQLDEITDY